MIEYIPSEHKGSSEGEEKKAAEHKKHKHDKKTHKAEKKAAKPYTLKTCLVSDEKLGEHGAPYVFTYQGREIKMCCKGCVKDFKKDSAKYIKKLELAEKNQDKKAN